MDKPCDGTATPLDELACLSEEASPGEWEVAHAKDEHVDFHYWCVDGVEPISRERADLVFACAAMNYVRALLAAREQNPKGRE